jgi:ribosomal protein S18 acetylase RimI-like enzyme
MVIRDYHEKDFDEFCVLMNELNDYIASVDAKNIVKSFSTQDDIEAYTNQIIKDANERNGFIYLAEENGKIIGFIQGIINDNKSDVLYKLSHVPFSDGWIGELYVKPEFRGRGLGKQLIERARQYFRDNGCRFIRLTVLSDNADSVKIYKKLGFETRDLELVKELL